MSWQLPRERVKSIVLDALQKIADFRDDDPNIERNNFKAFSDFHEKVFLMNIKLNLLNQRFIWTNQGKRVTYCYNIPLNEDMIHRWVVLGACIDYVYNKQQLLEVQNKIAL